MGDVFDVRNLHIDSFSKEIKTRGNVAIKILSFLSKSICDCNEKYQKPEHRLTG